MAAISKKKRIWGWMAFDFATQPIHTLGLTFIFGPYFAAVAYQYFLGIGFEDNVAKANSQSLWGLGQTLAGLFIAFTAPVLGAFADNSGRKIPWMVLFSVIYVIGVWSIWFLYPDGTNLHVVLILFFVGFIAAELALNFANAILPSLGNNDEVGKISGSALAFGYWGGVIGLFATLIFFAEDETGKTLVGLTPALGLDGSAREGTRSVGPFIAIWFIFAMIPFFLWVRDEKTERKSAPSFGKVIMDLWNTIKSLRNRRSLGAFLLGGMFYRDALNALYAFGGFYAALVLEWPVTKVGVFGIVAAIAAAIFTYIAGLCDRRFGPKPVIIVAILLLVGVCFVAIGLDKTTLYGVQLTQTPAFSLPMLGAYSIADAIFSVCGIVIGGAGGALYSASRSLMVYHAEPGRETEAFGLFALSGKATAFLAPALITLFTTITKSTQLGFIPVIVLFGLGLVLLRWVNKDGDVTA